MKKKNNKKTIPAYAFGMDQLSNYLGGANVFGSAISGLSEEGSTGDIAGSTIGSAASLAGAHCRWSYWCCCWWWIRISEWTYWFN